MIDLDNLDPLEAEYRDKLLALFQRVQPRVPDKGIRTLLARARKRMADEGLPQALVLEEMYRGALERTERRVRLLERCPLSNPDVNA